MSVTYKKAPRKRLQNMQPKKAKAIMDAINKFAAAPNAKHNNVAALNNVSGGFRLRIGDWRASFTLDADAGDVDVFEISPRGGTYR